MVYIRDGHIVEGGGGGSNPVTGWLWPRPPPATPNSCGMLRMTSTNRGASKTGFALPFSFPLFLSFPFRAVSSLGDLLRK